MKLEKIKETLLNGSVIAYPTEGVWGLGCDPSNEKAARRILELKNRAFEKGLILVADKIERFSPYIKDLPNADQLVPKNEAGDAITWIIEHGGLTPDWVSGGRPTIAIRVSEHPVICQLSQVANSPLVSTSANPSGLPSALNEDQVRSYFGSRVDLIVSGPLGGQNGASEIREFSTGKILRQAGT